MKAANNGRLLRIGAVVLISGALLLLFGAIGAFYFWKVNDKHVSDHESNKHNEHLSFPLPVPAPEEQM